MTCSTGTRTDQEHQARPMCCSTGTRTRQEHQERPMRWVHRALRFPALRVVMKNIFLRMHLRGPYRVSCNAWAFSVSLRVRLIGCSGCEVGVALPSRPLSVTLPLLGPGSDGVRCEFKSCDVDACGCGSGDVGISEVISLHLRLGLMG